jgi:hypothetical protein
MSAWISIIEGKADMPLIATGVSNCFARADNIARAGKTYKFH